MPRQRQLFLLGFLACVGLIASALYFQYVKELEPCPLCIFQRVAVIATGVVMLIGFIHNPATRWGRGLYGTLSVLAAGAGLSIAGRQVWLQHLPADQVPECGPGLDYMLDVFPLTEVLAKVFKGSGECAEVQWVFIGLSIPEWMLLVFTAFIALGIYTIVRRD